MEGFATPEEAARGSVPARYVRVVGTVTRGGHAIVAQLMNDRPPYEIDTATCYREADGSWSEGSSSNSDGGFLATGENVGTWVGWREVPDQVLAARFVCCGVEKVVPAEGGCVFAVFDGIESESVFDSPQVSAWIHADGREEAVASFQPSEEERERWRRQLESMSGGTEPLMHLGELEEKEPERD